MTLLHIFGGGFVLSIVLPYLFQWLGQLDVIYQCYNSETSATNKFFYALWPEFLRSESLMAYMFGSSILVVFVVTAFSFSMRPIGTTVNQSSGAGAGPGNTRVTGASSSRQSTRNHGNG